MAQIKLLKINSDGLPQEFDSTADDITLSSFTVNGGAVLSSTGLDMNNTDISDIKDVSFNNPAVDLLNGIIVNKYMAESKDNVMDVGASIQFPVVTDVTGEVEAFRLPALAGVPSAVPTSGSGQLVFDSAGKNLYLWNGTEWDNMNTVSDSNRVTNMYTAGEAISACDFVYISAANTVSKAIANDDVKARAIGAAKAAILSAAQGNITSDGVLSGFTGLTAGSRYYLSAATAGASTTSVPTGSGHNIVSLGYAKSTTEMQLQLQYLAKRA